MQQGRDAASRSQSESTGSETDSPDTIEKGELHVHLNGAIPSSAIQEILSEESTEVPPGFNVPRDLVQLSPAASLAAYLTPWQVLRRLPKRPENLHRLVDAAIADLALNRVRFVELRSSVLYLATLQGCSVAAALERLIDSTRDAADRHGVRRGLVLTVPRGDYSAVNLEALMDAYKSIGKPRDVVGIDLAGDEEIPYPVELPALFRNAKDRYGFGVTVHAGETGRAQNIRDAVLLFGADRIGHGTAAGNEPHLMEFLAKQDVCIEVCPISNRLTGAVGPSDAHPLREFQKNGVPFVICSDNPGIHQRGLSDDHAVAMAEGVPLSDLKAQYALAKRYSFIGDWQ